MENLYGSSIAPRTSNGVSSDLQLVTSALGPRAQRTVLSEGAEARCFRSTWSFWLHLIMMSVKEWITPSAKEKTGRHVVLRRGQNLLIFKQN